MERNQGYLSNKLCFQNRQDTSALVLLHVLTNSQLQEILNEMYIKFCKLSAWDNC